MAKSTGIPNRLTREVSPYLLQHAGNPVDWFPWGEEAFAKARAEDKPVFLSVGYSTCHWCHVMAHECFEDAEVAARLNRDYVSIKVDKEERPDIDSVYMNVCVALTGSGGWPMTIIMDADGKPIFAGTYFPKYKRYGMPGLLDVLEAVRSKWDTDRGAFTRYADRVLARLSAAETRDAAQGYDPQTLIDQALRSLENSFDSRFGGFGAAPKFPMAHGLLFLLKGHFLAGDGAYLDMAEKTLLGMAKGGIFDQIGFGFSRYSTDEKWLAPHFEKMLYDNALLLMAYSKAYQQTQRAVYRTVAEKIITFISREMTASEGAFYAALDADSDGVEGKYYVFTPDEILSVLGDEQGARFNRLYDITGKGNFEGKSIPNQIALAAPDESLAGALPLLYEYRKSRASLHLDDKILTAWNALMIAALADAAEAFQREEYLAMALGAMDCLERLLTVDSTLYVSFRGGKRSGPGLIDDYAFLIYARLRLYAVTLEAKHLEHAQALMKKAADDFFDSSRGGFFLYGADAERLITRPKETHDGAIPSGNSVMAMNLALLFQLTGNKAYQALMEQHFAFMLGEATTAPGGHTFFALACLQKEHPGKKITVVMKNKNEKPAILEKLRGQGLVMLLEQETEDYPLLGGQTTFYVCEGFTCRPPVNRIEDAL